MRSATNVATAARPSNHAVSGGVMKRKSSATSPANAGVLEALLVTANVPVGCLHGLEPLRLSALDFRQTGTLIEAAYRAVRWFLDELQVSGPGLYGSP
jgi:hypothetical protein